MAESESTETGSMHRSVHEDEYYMAYDRSESAPVARVATACDEPYQPLLRAEPERRPL